MEANHQNKVSSPATTTKKFVVNSVVKKDGDVSETFDDSVYTTESGVEQENINSVANDDQNNFNEKITDQAYLPTSLPVIKLPANLLNVLLPKDEIIHDHFSEIFKQSVFMRSNDPKVFGEFIAIVYNLNETVDSFCCYLFDKFGCSFHENTNIKADSKYYAAIENLNEQNKKLNVQKVIAVSLLQKFAYAKAYHKDYFKKINFDPTDAGLALNDNKLVETNSNLTPFQIGLKMQQMACLESRKIDSLFLDVIYENNPHIIDENNNLVFHLGEQLEQLFNPLTEYSPEQTEIIYKPVPSDSGVPLLSNDNELVKSIVKEFVDIQTNFTVELVNFLQKFIIPIRIKVSKNEISGLSFSKLNRLFPPTIDEVTRINCIFLDALKLSQTYGSLQVLKACSITISYFYKAYTRHEAATKKFHKDIKLFLSKFFQDIPLNDVYTEFKLETIIKGPLEKITKYKLILNRIWKEKQWESEEAEAEATKYYNNVIDIIDTFGNQATPSSKIASYHDRVFTPSGKILTELADKWPIELQYKWLKRRVVGVFDAIHHNDNKRDVVVIFNDYVVFLNIVDDDLYYSAGSNKPLIADILMNSLINEVPLPNTIPQLVVRKHVHINELLVTSFGGDNRQIRFDILDNKSSPIYYQLVSPTDTSQYICELITKACILCKSTAFHLFRKEFTTIDTDTHTHPEQIIKSYVTAHELSSYKDEKIKSPFAIFLNIEASYEALVDNGVYFGAFVKFLENKDNMVELKIITLKNKGITSKTVKDSESSVIVPLDQYTKVIMESLVKKHLKEYYYSLDSPLSKQLLFINSQIVKQVQEPIKFFTRGLVKSDNLQQFPKLQTVDDITPAQSDVHSNTKLNITNANSDINIGIDNSKSNSTIATFSSSNEKDTYSQAKFDNSNSNKVTGIRNSSTVITKPTGNVSSEIKPVAASISKPIIKAENKNVKPQYVKSSSNKKLFTTDKTENVKLRPAPKTNIRNKTKDNGLQSEKKTKKQNRLSKIFGSIFGSSHVNSTNEAKVEMRKQDTSNSTEKANKAKKRQSMPLIISEPLFKNDSDQLSKSPNLTKSTANKKRFSMTSVPTQSLSFSPEKTNLTKKLSIYSSPIRSSNSQFNVNTHNIGSGKTPISSPLKIERTHIDNDLEIPRMHSNIEQDKMFNPSTDNLPSSPLAYKGNKFEINHIHIKNKSVDVFNDDLYGEILNKQKDDQVNPFLLPSTSEKLSPAKEVEITRNDEILANTSIDTGRAPIGSEADLVVETKPKSVFAMPEQKVVQQRKPTIDLVTEKMNLLPPFKPSVKLDKLEPAGNATISQSESFRDLFQGMEMVLQPNEKAWNWVSLEKSASLENLEHAMTEENHHHLNDNNDLFNRYYERIAVPEEASDVNSHKKSSEPNDVSFANDSTPKISTAQSITEEHEEEDEENDDLDDEDDADKTLEEIENKPETHSELSKVPGVQESPSKMTQYDDPENQLEHVKKRINFQSKFRVVKSSSPIRNKTFPEHSDLTSNKITSASPKLMKEQIEVNDHMRLRPGSVSSGVSSLYFSPDKDKALGDKRLMELKDEFASTSRDISSRDTSFTQSDLEKDLGDSTLEFSEFDVTFNKESSPAESGESHYYEANVLSGTPGSANPFAQQPEANNNNNNNNNNNEPIFYDYNTTSDNVEVDGNGQNVMWVSPSKLDAFDISKKSPSMYEQLKVNEEKPKVLFENNNTNSKNTRTSLKRDQSVKILRDESYGYLSGVL